MAHPLQFTHSHQRRKREKKKKKTQKHIEVSGFRSALDHGWVASARRGCVSSWGVGGRRCSWLAVGCGSSQFAVGRRSWVKSASPPPFRHYIGLQITQTKPRNHRPLLHMRCHSISLIFHPSSSPITVGLIRFLGFIFLDFWVSFFCVFQVLIFWFLGFIFLVFQVLFCGLIGWD